MSPKKGIYKESLKWDCICECGKTKSILGRSLTHGMCKSCGCGCTTKFKIKHGMCNTLEYHSWQGMKRRALVKEKRYKSYEGKGADQRWLDSFEEFFKDMGLAPSPRHTIERKDNSKGYFKWNCVWATSKEQTRNYSLNRVIEYNGIKLCVTDWATRLNIPRYLIYHRLDAGWSIEKALMTPKSLKHSNNKY